MSKSKLFGHDIEVKDNVWVFSDTLEPTEGSHTKRKCGFCGKHRDKSDHDPCIKDLPYTLNACCGHGNVGDVYVMLQDRGCYYGEKAVQLIKWLRKEKQSPQEFKPIEISKAIRNLGGNNE